MATRKEFIGKSSLGFFALFNFHLSALSSDNSEFEGLVVDKDEGEAYQLKGGTSIVRIKVAKNQGAQSLSFLTESFPPGQAVLIHKHLNEDEFIFLNKGSGLFTLGEKDYEIKEGALAFVPKGVWHGLQNTGNVNIEVCFGYSPAGLENFFREIGVPLGQPYVQKPIEERRALAKKYGFIGKQNFIHGTWELDVATSVFGPGLAWRKQTRHYNSDGRSIRLLATGIMENGNTVQFEYYGAYDGKDYPVIGSPKAETIAQELIDKNNNEKKREDHCYKHICCIRRWKDDDDHDKRNR